MIHKNIWKPDTCDCEIEYEWDDSVLTEQRVHTVSKIIKCCDAHKNLTDKVQNYNTVVNENTRKNILYGKILEIPSLVQERTKENGEKIKELKEGLEYRWSFDKDRNLEVELVGFGTEEKNIVKDLAQTNFGNKVKIK